MTATYRITGMTCQGCVASVQEKLLAVDGVEQVVVDLSAGEAEVSMRDQLPLSAFRNALPEKYAIEEGSGKVVQAPSKFQQLKPLFLIFGYLFTASILLNYRNWDSNAAMLDFMGLFYIVFSFFKLLDLKGFPKSFQMYDPLAKAVPVYGWIYPFFELGLGLLFLMRIQLTVALVATIIILGITTIGVVQTLLNKKAIRCACLGTALNLPMTEATFIENAIMLIMAVSMLTVF
ncbi:MAG: MauE/DoxX family redox-associated membrane protein [Bacteroidota bacterium]